MITSVATTAPISNPPRRPLALPLSTTTPPRIDPSVPANRIMIPITAPN